jgi:N-acetylglucosamine-6-sulfatase
MRMRTDQQRPGHRAWVPILLATLVVAGTPLSVAWLESSPAIAPLAGGTAVRPNIVIIMSDDQRWDTIEPQVMPRLMDRMVPGVNAVYLSNAFVSNPLCCPSRVTTLTGQYSDTSGVYGNDGTFSGGVGVGGGGFYAFDDDPAVNPTIATDLQGAGYRTALIGKYLNKYPGETNWSYVPPDWDRWFSVPTGAYYDYLAASDGHRRWFGDAPSDYSTRILTSRAADFIEETSATGTPFFLYLALTAPHGPAIAYPQDIGRFDAYVDGYHHPASVGESNIPDKPEYIRNRAWTREIQDGYDAFHARQLSAIYGVDRAVGRIWDTLPDNTVVLYMSDNGYEWGEHRWEEKFVPYNESIRVPMILATKGLDMPSIDPDRIALNVDIRATLGSFAGLSPTTKGHTWTDPSWSRSDFVLEHWTDGTLDVPTYCGVRSTRWMYTRYATGEEELYDERADPLELANLVSRRPPTLSALRARAQVLCRQGNVYPPDWPF